MTLKEQMQAAIEAVNKRSLSVAEINEYWGQYIGTEAKGFTATRVSMAATACAELARKHYEGEIAKLRTGAEQALTILSEKRPNTPGLGGPIFLLKTALRND